MLDRFSIQKHGRAIFTPSCCPQLRHLNWKQLKRVCTHAHTHTDQLTHSHGSSPSYTLLLWPSFLRKPRTRPYVVTYRLQQRLREGCSAHAARLFTRKKKLSRMRVSIWGGSGAGSFEIKDFCDLCDKLTRLELQTSSTASAEVPQSKALNLQLLWRSSLVNSSNPRPPGSSFTLV